jgi:outer membrane protein
MMNFKLTAAFLISVFSIQLIQAQSTLKIGHVNIQEIVQKHPSTDSIRKVLETETKEMENLYNEMLTEHENKLGVFEKEKAGYSDFVRNSKEKELIGDGSKNSGIQPNRPATIAKTKYGTFKTGL